MNLIGRYEKVRTLGPQGWGLGYILDRGRAQSDARLLPYRPEWWCNPEGIWLPSISGGIGFSASKQHPRMTLLWNDHEFGQGQTTLALSSNYIAGTSGAAIACRLVLPATLTLNNVYFFLSGYTGTAANVNDIDIEIRSDSSNLPDTTAPGLLSSATHNPASTTGWQNVSGLSQSLTGGTQYWIIVGDADGNTTDFATVHRNQNNIFVAIREHGDMLGAQTTNGWVSGNTLSPNTPSCVLVFSDGSVTGSSLAALFVATSNTLQKGVLLDGITASLKLFAVQFTPANNNLSGSNIWVGTTGPTGTPYASSTITIKNSASVDTGVLFSSPVLLQAATQYRIVATASASMQVPHKLQISTGADANLRAAAVGGGTWYWTEDVASAWSDDINGWPKMNLIVEDLVREQPIITRRGGALV